MKDLIEKIDGYDFINHLIPGSILLVFYDYFFGCSFTKMNSVTFLILAFVTGIIIGRVGSLLFHKVVYQIFKKEKNGSYVDFIKASLLDSKIDTYMISKNLYRNLSSTVLLMILSFVFSFIRSLLGISDIVYIIILLVLLLFLFIYSTLYFGGIVDNRVDAVLKNKRNKRVKKN